MQGHCCFLANTLLISTSMCELFWPYMQGCGLKPLGGINMSDRL